MKRFHLSDRRLSTKLFICYTLPLALAMIVYLLIFTVSRHYIGYNAELEQQTLSSRQNLSMLQDGLKQMDIISQMTYNDMDDLDAVLAGSGREGYFKAYTDLREHYGQFLWLTPRQENVLLLDCDGNSLVLSHNDAAWITLQNTSSCLWFQKTLAAAGKPHFFYLESMPFLGLDYPCLATARAIISPVTHQPVAVSLVYQSVKEMDYIFSAIQVNQDTLINVVDGEGQVVYSNCGRVLPVCAERQFHNFDLVCMDRKAYLFTSVTDSSLDWSINACLPFHPIPSLRQFFSIPNVSVVLVLLVLSALLSYLFSLSVTKPLRKLTSALKVTQSGDFSYNMEVSGSDEIALINRAYNQMNDKIDRLIHEKYDLTIAETQARLKALQYQINPHFLFNTLNSIGATCENPVSLKMIQSLGQMMRYSLSNDFSCVPFFRELSCIREYLYLQGCRFGDRCTYELDIDEATMNLSIPRLSLQPLVENAFQHGVEPQVKACKIIITSKLIGNRFHIYISNTGLPMDPETLEKLNQCFRTRPETGTDMGIGLINVWSRLLWHFGQSCAMHISSNERFTTVYLELPAVEI